MSRKTSGTSNLPSSPPGSGVDFLFRTMIERESTGKRKIRPKNVEDLYESVLGDESDDPDYEEADGGSASNSEGSDEESSPESANSNSEESGTSDSSTESSGEDDSDSENSDDEGKGSSNRKEKKSALRETLQKINETSFETKKAKKKRRKPVGTTNASRNKKATAPNAETETDVNATSSSRKRPASTSISNSKSKTRKMTKSKKLRKEVPKSKSKTKDKFKMHSKSKKKEKRQKNRRSKYASISSLLEGVMANQKENRKEIDESRSPICSVCLGEKSDESNEIVVCDFCGITVHEGCYGVGDSLSVSSSGSSCSTEPWFCDACKHGEEKITCDLCPTAGGLFKETSTGRWIHVVCALYTQGVGLGDPENPPNTTGLRYRWGTHTCSLCESERYATTGVPIPCDAGLCKTYLHATCAQRAGLLSDYSQIDPTEADPYYAACKLHTNREVARRRATSYKILQEQLRIRKERKDSDLPAFEKNRIAQKLLKVRRKNAFKRSKIVHTSPLNTKDVQKKSRFLQTSTSAGDIFLNKAELMGEDVKALETEDRNERIVTNVKRKWNVQAAISVEFAAYYNDREAKIATMSQQCESLEHSNMALNDKQIALKSAWDTNCLNNQAMAENSEEIKTKIEKLTSILQELGTPSKKFLNSCGVLSKSGDQGSTSRRSPTRSNVSSAMGNASKNKMMKLLTPPHLGRLSMSVKCDICNTSEGQHMITNCDECKKNYHLGCLDPPLTRLPKRTRLQGWVCSDCNDADSQCEDDSKEAQVDTDAPRTLRGRTNIKKPGKYRNSDESGEEDVKIIAVPQMEKKSPVPHSLISPEVKIIPELNPSINGNIRSSRRRSGGGSNTSSTNVSDKSPSAVKGGNASSATVDDISTLVETGKGVTSSTDASSKRKNKRRVKRKYAKNLLNLEQDTTPALTPKGKASMTEVDEKLPLGSTIRETNIKTDSIKQNVDNVTAVIMENSLVRSTPLESNPIITKKSPCSSKKKNVALSTSTAVQSSTPDPKSVPLKKRRRISSVHTPLSEKSGVQNSNGPANYRNNVIGSINRNTTAEHSINLKIKQPPQLGITENHVEIPSTNNTSVNSTCVNNFSTGLISLSSTFGFQPNASANHAALIDVSKNVKFNRDRNEKEPISLLTSMGPTSLNSQSQNHFSLPYNSELSDSSCSFTNDSSAMLSSSEGKCITCGKEDSRKHLVTCDKCRLDFHFTCLDPPLKYSPKRRGYSWFCANCDETSSTDSKAENDVGVN